MDQEPEKPSTPFIPPPTLAKPSTPPPSPMDTMRPAAPASAPDAKVDLHVVAPGEEGVRKDGLASFGNRAIALVIDFVVIVGLSAAMRMILPGFLAPIGGLLGLAYLLTRDSLPFLGGQSVGKKAMKLQAVTLEGRSLAGDWKTGAIRNATLAIPLVIFVEIYFLLTREDKPDHGKRLGDELAKTKVIVVKPPVVEE